MASPTSSSAVIDVVIEVDKASTFRAASSKMIAKCTNTGNELMRGRLVACNDTYLAYSVRGTGIRILHKKLKESAFIENPDDRVLDMMFLGGSEGNSDVLVICSESGDVNCALLKVNESTNPKLSVEVSCGYEAPAGSEYKGIGSKYEVDPFIRVVSVPGNAVGVVGVTLHGRVFLFEAIGNSLIVIASNDKIIGPSASAREEVLAAGGVQDVSVSLDAALIAVAFRSGRIDLYRLNNVDMVRQCFVTSTLSPSDAGSLSIARFVGKGMAEYLVVGLERNTELCILHWRSGSVLKRMIFHEKGVAPAALAASSPVAGGPADELPGFWADVEPSTGLVAVFSPRHPVFVAVPLSNDLGKEAHLRFLEPSRLQAPGPIFSSCFFSKFSSDSTSAADEAAGVRKVGVFAVTPKSVELLVLGVREMVSPPVTSAAVSKPSQSPENPARNANQLGNLFQALSVPPVPGSSVNGVPNVPPRPLNVPLHPVGAPMFAGAPPPPIVLDPHVVDMAVSSSVARSLSNMNWSALVADVLGPRLPDAVEKAVVEQVRPKLLEELKASFKDNFATHLVPLIENIVKNMFTQITSALQSGLASEFAAFKQSSRSEIREVVAKEVLAVQQGLQLCIKEECASLADSLAKTLSEASPAATASAQEKLRAQVSALIDSRSYEVAFKTVLSASDLGAVVWVCDRLRSVSTDICSSLSAPTLLSLIQQLSFDLSNDVLLKMMWLQDAVTSLDVSDRRVAARATPVLSKAISQLRAAEHLAQASGPECVRTYKLLARYFPAVLEQATAAQ